jgi:glycosyltransferase involved in cell wall biosynthesis
LPESGRAWRRRQSCASRRRPLTGAGAHLDAPAPVELSIVVCVLDEEANIGPFLTAVDEVLPALGLGGHEYVFVDDGSSDATWERIRALGESRGDVVGVRLLRNVGKENALAAGLAAARGEVHVPMDVDLQDPPDVLAELVRAWRAGAELVLARRRSREDSRLRRLGAFVTYRMLERGGGVSIPRDVGDFRLMTRATTSRFLALPERSRYNKGLLAFVAPDAVVVEYERPASREGDPAGPRQTLPKLVRLGTNAIVSFSTWPLQALSVVGFVLLGLSILGGILGVILRATDVLEVPGQATVVVLFAFLLGFQALSTGVLGLYVAQILTEVKRRPLYSVAETFGVPAERLERLDEVARA